MLILFSQAWRQPSPKLRRQGAAIIIQEIGDELMVVPARQLVVRDIPVRRGVPTRGSEGFRSSRSPALLIGRYRKEGLRKRKQRLAGRYRLLNSLVGVRGFEPPASTSRT
jgi:hypothetical protein